MKEIENGITTSPIYKSKQDHSVVLSREEVKELIKCIDNVKDSAIAMLAYSSGLRLSELVALKIKDIDFVEMQIRVEQGKGKQDRITILSESVLDILENYLQLCKPKEWLFEETDGGQYSIKNIHQLIIDAAKKAGIKSKIDVNTLRQSFAAHLLEAGTNFSYVKSLFGHDKSEVI